MRLYNKNKEQSYHKGNTYLRISSKKRVLKNPGLSQTRHNLFIIFHRKKKKKENFLPTTCGKSIFKGFNKHCIVMILCTVQHGLKVTTIMTQTKISITKYLAKTFKDDHKFFMHKDSHFWLKFPCSFFFLLLKTAGKYANTDNLLTCGKLKAVLLSPIIARESRIWLTWKRWIIRITSEILMMITGTMQNKEEHTWSIFLLPENIINQNNQ